MRTNSLNRTGLDELVRPEITLKGADGEVTATRRSSAEQPYVRSVEFTATQDETFTFDVTAIEPAEDGRRRTLAIQV